MVHIRTILTLSIAILAIDNVLIEAGKATEDRKQNLSNRASKHADTLRPFGNKLKMKFGSQMSQQVVGQLTDISNVIIDHIMKHESFPKYLKNVFSVLRKYAVRQIMSRFKKLEKTYKKWEKQNFPDKQQKANALEILYKQEGRTIESEKISAKKSKKKDKKSGVKYGVK
ncbi:uncharacterized protein LOC113549535 [Rhopalosiphum maidis]|uniref:uncharacterized protein LOC113549535 n=1 Tax=Rhopalosiphum maidis TaxID=43146 RepID=UPI000EFE1245|nr:uncharacterized protein LOC113549535 [Rhopalosiphum maidis]